MLLPSLLFALIAVTVANPIILGPIETRTMNEIYQAALKENGTLRVSIGGDNKLLGDRIIRTFNDTYPGIALDVLVDSSKYLGSAIDRTYRTSDGSDDGADVAALASIHEFPRWRDAKRLMPYKVIPFDDIYPQFVDPDGAYTSHRIYTLGSIIYNPMFTDNSTLPTTYAGFLEPEWVDRLVLLYPHDENTSLYFFSLVTKKYRFDFITKLIDTKRARWVRGSSTPMLMIGRTEINSTINAQSVSFTSYSTESDPHVAAIPPEDTYFAWTSAAIFATTKVPESAKLFMNFLLSDERQATAHFESGQKRLSVRKTYDDAGIFTQKGVDPLGFEKFMADRAEVERWQMQFESLLGPPQGPDPVSIY